MEMGTLYPGAARPGLGRVRFLSRLEEIRVAVGKGYPLRVIYETQQEALAISYSQFIRYVSQYIRRQRPGQPAEHMREA